MCKNNDCIIGSIAGTEIRRITGKSWDEAVKNHQAALAYFATARKTVPHPGHMYQFQFCPECGAKIPALEET